jgi:hypothetical protein
MFKPKPQDYPSHYTNYINCVEAETVSEIINKYSNSITSFCTQLPKDKANFAYAIGKWTVKEVLQHLIDAERIFVYRALRFSRKDNTEIEGYDENLYVDNAHSNERHLEDIIQEFIALRKSTDFFLNSLNTNDLVQVGIANNGNISVNAIAFIIYGHILHHIKILKERYL